MNRHQYYEDLKALAREVRREYALTTPRVLRSDLRRIYKAKGIRIDLSPSDLRTLRGAYFYDELGPSVLLARNLPTDPMVFTMAHELKHHLVDRDQIVSYCDASNEKAPIEIGAEVFAAELIYPEQDWVDWLTNAGIEKEECTPEVLVRMKRETRTTLSYTGLAKRAERLGYAPAGTLRNIKWKKLEEALYGEPVHKRILRYRRLRS